jgi:hypothetical protein
MPKIDTRSLQTEFRLSNLPAQAGFEFRFSLLAPNSSLYRNSHSYRPQSFTLLWSWHGHLARAYGRDARATKQV